MSGSAGVEVAEADVALFRRARTAARLADGRVLAAGGQDAPSDVAEVFDPKTSKWSRVGSLRVARTSHAVVALASGKALVCGGEVPVAAPAPIHVLLTKAIADCELFDPATGQFGAAAAMTAPRKRFTLTRLADGKVLAIGDPGGEIFDPKTMTWGQTVTTAVGYLGHTATVLRDGRVLVVGLATSPPKGSAETFDPATAKFTPTLPGAPTLMDHTATLLPDGSVLVAGGQMLVGAFPQPVPFAAVFEPKRERWNVTGQPHLSHVRQGALLLPGGDVVVGSGAADEAEVYGRESWKELPPELAAKLHLEQRPAATTVDKHKI